MYCLKCGNLLKKEDNFCSICGTPNNAEAKRMSQGISGYGPIRDDEPINLDDFFKTDEKTERTLVKIDRELEEIKARATENLLRRQSGDPSARRAARLAKKAASGSVRRDKQSYEFNTDLDFNDDVFQNSIRQEVLVGRRGQLKNKTDELRELQTPGVPSYIAEEKEFTFKHLESKADMNEEAATPEVEDQGTSSKPIQTPVPKAAKPKRHHLFRENTVEIPNIFDEIAESMQKSRQQEREPVILTDKEDNDDMPLTWRVTDHDPVESVSAMAPLSADEKERIFPLPPSDDFIEGVFPLPPKDNKEDFVEGIFPLPSKDDFAEGVFPLPPNDDFTEGIFPLPPKSQTGDDAEVTPAAIASQATSEINGLTEGAGQIHSWDVEGDREQEKEVYALRRPSRSQTANTPRNADEPEYEYFRYRSKKKKGPNPLLIAVAVLIIIIAAVGTKMLYDGETPASVFHQLQEVFAASGGLPPEEGLDVPIDTDDDTRQVDTEGADTDGAPPDISELKEQGISDPGKMLQYILSKGINKNIKAVEYNPDLKYDTSTKYKADDITNSKPITENLFYEKNGEKYYYTESIIGTMIQYNSQWVDYFNDQNPAVLELIKKGSKAYQDAIDFSSDGAREECVLLEIGEIRKGKDGYYVWTKEVYNVTKGAASKSEDSQWIYYLEPSGENMKIVNYYYY